MKGPNNAGLSSVPGHDPRYDTVYAAEVPGPGYYLAWQDADGGGIEEQYRTLGDAVERGEIAQRWIEAGGNASRRRYEVRERVYGRVVWRAMMQERRVGR